MNNHTRKVSKDRRDEIHKWAKRYTGLDGRIDLGSVVVATMTPMSIVREVLGIRKPNETKHQTVT